MADESMKDEDSQDVPNGNSGGANGSIPLRPVFLGNLKNEYASTDITDIFNRPLQPRGAPEGTYAPIPVDRIDLKRGYCFVFLKDAPSEDDKGRAEQFVTEINGMEIPNVSDSLRAEFARGDGRIKRKEDDRRRNIQPSETLFVVNFHEETTKREDLQMLFEPFGELVRIDMKRNYAFVQFRTIEEASRAKEVTDGGKLDQSVLTVEFVARQRNGGGGGDRRRRDDRDRRGYDRRGPDRRGGGDRDRFGYDRRVADRYDRDRDDPRRDDFRSRGRDRSPAGIRGSSPGGSYYRSGSPGGYRRRSRSRSRSPRAHRSRSPRRYDDRDRARYDDYRDGGRRGSSPSGYRDRGRSPDKDVYRGARDDRGYRP